MTVFDTATPAGVVRAAGAAAALFVAATGTVPGIARVGLALAGLALAVQAFSNLTEPGA
jgi:hypothetical protein